MNKYPKIENVFVRDPKTHKLIVNQYRNPIFESLRFARWDVTEKLDGMNIRIMRPAFAERLRLAGRSDQAQIPWGIQKWFEDHYRDLQAGLNQEDWMPFPVCLYGAGIGPGIQKAGDKYGHEQRVVAFDLIIGGRWATYDEMSSYLEPCIEVVDRLPCFTLVDAINHAMRPFDSHHGSGKAKGVIAKPTHELRDQRGNRIITKIKTQDFKQL